MRVISIVLLWAIAPSLALASLGGPTFTDAFDGTVKDTNRWEERTTNGGSITQNDALTFLGGADGEGEYTTRQIKIPVGGFVRADVSVHEFAPNASGILSLSTNTSGTAAPLFNDSYKINFQFYNSAALLSSGDSNSESGQSYPISWPDNTFATIEIERATSTLANFRIYTSSGATFFSQSRSVAAFNSDLFVTLDGPGNGVVTWDNVTFPLSALPEPNSLAMMVFVAIPLMNRRRWTPRSQRRKNG